MTEDELKGLTMGDKVHVRAEVLYVYKNGSQCMVAVYDESGYRDRFYVKAGDVYRALPGKTEGAVKDVACRLFRKGDKVQPRSGKTVLASEYGFVTFHELAGQYEVNEDEARGTVTLIVNGHACFVSAFALELITPVEELEKWGVYHDKDGSAFEVKTEDHMETAGVIFYGPGIRTEEEAEKEAEEMHDRLNAEWRKGNNG